MTVTDGRGRTVRDGGLARWLRVVAPARVAGDVAVALVSTARIRRLNHQFRGKDAPTDVLAFPSDGPAAAPAADPRSRIARPSPEGDEHIGDIVIASEIAKRQAREAGHSYTTELRVLALHGLLHLLGYDHEAPDDDGRMARAESRLRRKGGLREGLIARTGTAREDPPPAIRARDVQK